MQIRTFSAVNSAMFVSLAAAFQGIVLDAVFRKVSTDLNFRVLESLDQTMDAK